METKELALKIKESICQWARLNILLLACMILIRIAFLAATYFRIDIETSKCAIILSGCIFDLITISHIIAYGLVPFIILHHFLPKTSRVICMILISIYCIFSLLLTEYFCNTTMPLDHVVFAYSPEEIQGIIKTSVSIGVPTIACFVIPAIAITILMFVWKKVKFNIIISGAIIIASVATAIAINYTKTIEYEKLYSNHKDFCLATNQPSYSIIKIATHINDFQSESSLETIKTASAEYQNLFPDKEFVNDGYPLYHKNKYNDVLGNFISKTSDGNPPNFVFIIVESLGQRLTGVQNESISFTPFIDSLKHEGLYWNNCLAASERTFGVLPAIFASAPYGQYGFVQIWDPMPNHNSLLKDMTANGYQSSYFYGGVHEFDRYDIFLKTNNVEYIYVPKIDDIDSSIYKTLNDYHRWGIDDKNLVENAIKYKKNNPSTQPYIDIYMTLSTHEPFIFDDIETYKAKVKEMVGKQNISNKEEKNNILNNLDIFACFAYTDDCIKELMDYYKTLPEYENTIFVITGDHRMGMLTLPLGVTLSACNVPLIIYSPLIKTPREMKAVVAHEDITPSLNAYLSHNYEYTTSDYCHWIGNELDTAKEYRCNKKIAFMKNNRDVVDYLNGDYYISRGNILSSSRIRILGFFKMTRAMESRCFSPPESFSPRLPTRVS